MIEYIIWVICLGYIGYLLALLIGWLRLNDQFDLYNKEIIKFTVIIPVRNEATHILELLNDLENQSYDKKNFEVLVIDDFSEDETTHIVEKAIQELKMDVKLYKKVVEIDQQGKKNSITKGVALASNSKIICTDGDCRVGDKWLDQYRIAYITSGAKMILGPVVYRDSKNWFKKLQKIEFSALIGLGASSLELGMPNICNGANISYDKELFQELNGYEGNESIPSGDDEFLLQKAYDVYPEEIFFNKSYDAISYTEAKDSLSDFINQRIRWSSKWKFHKTIRMKLWGLSMFLFNLALVFFYFLMFKVEHQELFISTFFVKLIVEYIYIYKVNSDLHDEIGLLHSILLQLIYPFYLIFLMMSSFLRRYRWKGRVYL